MVQRVQGYEGQRYGRLVVLDSNPEPKGSRKWKCLCDCGAETLALSTNVVRGLTKGCGCKVKEGNHTHGLFGTPTYVSWNMMKQRCTNPRNTNWENYGGRGIQVCEKWLAFEGFLEDMGLRPKDTSIDRIDVDGGYQPGNCRWADAKTPARNTRRAKGAHNP